MNKKTLVGVSYVSAWVIVWGTIGSIIDFYFLQNTYLPGSAGQFLTSTASGTFTNATSGQYIMGKSITGCASGSLFLLDIQHNGYKG